MKLFTINIMIKTRRGGSAAHLGVKHALQALTLGQQLAQEQVPELRDVLLALHAHGGTQTRCFVGGCEGE
jgi:hypothetical protein